MKKKSVLSIFSGIWLVAAISSILSFDEGGLFNIISSLILVIMSFVGAGYAIYMLIKNKKAKSK